MCGCKPKRSCRWLLSVVRTLKALGTSGASGTPATSSRSSTLGDLASCLLQPSSSFPFIKIASVCRISTQPSHAVQNSSCTLKSPILIKPFWATGRSEACDVTLNVLEPMSNSGRQRRSEKKRVICIMQQTVFFALTNLNKLNKFLHHLQLVQFLHKGGQLRKIKLPQLRGETLADLKHSHRDLFPGN